MKLAEALILRSDLQKRMEQLRERLTASALVQEGEQPPENPEELLQELSRISNELQNLIGRINLTNACEQQNGSTLTELLARREVLTQKISILRSFLDAASRTVMRGSRSEVKIRSTVSVGELRRQADDLAKELRLLDTSIQGANWLIELR